MYSNYYECQNDCKLTFGQKECEKCTYYQNCMTEYEIDQYELKHDKKLNNLLSRIENGEHI